MVGAETVPQLGWGRGCPALAARCLARPAIDSTYSYNKPFGGIGSQRISASKHTSVMYKVDIQCWECSLVGLVYRWMDGHKR